MPSENPFNVIKAMNVTNEQARVANNEGQKEVLSEEVEKLKQRIVEIRGTQAEMISQYHEAIREAKKDPKTLVYVKDHFRDLFKEGISKWQELRSELDVIKGEEENKTEVIKNIDTRTELSVANKKIDDLQKTLDQEKNKSLPWWKRFPDYDFDDRDYAEVEKYIKENGLVRARELNLLNDLNYKKSEEEKRGLTPLEIRVISYMSTLDELNRDLTSQGREVVEL